MCLCLSVCVFVCVVLFEFNVKCYFFAHVAVFLMFFKKEQFVNDDVSEC